VKLLSRVVAACRKANGAAVDHEDESERGEHRAVRKGGGGSRERRASGHNSYPAMAIDIETRKPKLANITGG